MQNKEELKMIEITNEELEKILQGRRNGRS